jgi:transcriptional regulator with XRE-family HTH domain
MTTITPTIGQSAKPGLRKMSARKQDKAGRLERAGRLLYGDRWQSPLARATGISQSAISMMCAGERTVTADAEEKLAAAIDRELERLQRTSRELTMIRKEIAATS